MVNSSSTSSSEQRARLRAELLVVLAVVAGIALLDRLTTLPPLVGAEFQARRAYESITYRIDPTHAPGLSALTRVRTNAQGLRGAEFSRSRRNIVLLGGSTTYAQLLDDDDALMTRVQRHLSPGPREVAVATSARGGQTVLDSLRNLEQLGARPDTRPDVVVAMLGANRVEQYYSLAPWTGPDGQPTGASLPDDSPYAPARFDRTFAGLYIEPDGAFMTRLRQAYRSQQGLDALTPLLERWLDRHLDDHEVQLQRLADRSTALGAPLVLVTQPMNWSGVEDERVQTWALGFIRTQGTGFVPAPRLLAELLERVNDRTRRFARQADIPLVDLADLGRDCAPCFYDQWHFTVQGADRAGARIAAAIPPDGFADGAPDGP